VTYEHTQKAPLYLLVLAVAAAEAGLAVWLGQKALAAAIVLGSAASVMVLAALCFRQLTVRDEGDRLAIRFGPLPVFRRRIAYADITAVEVGRSSLIDGWGIHRIAGRGTTYNLWGFACVVLRVGGRTIRIGTDDAEALAAFLKTKLSPASGGR